MGGASSTDDEKGIKKNMGYEENEKNLALTKKPSPVFGRLRGGYTLRQHQLYGEVA